MSDPVPAMSKVCSECQIEKERGAFWKMAAAKDGLQNRCKECHRVDKRSPARMAQAAAYAKRWRARPENAALKKMQKRRNYYRHREASLARSRRWVEENRDKMRVCVRKSTRKRKAVIAASATSPPSRGWRPVLRRDPCSYCGGPGGATDHIDSLGQYGDHGDGNLTGACKSCNSAKGTKRLLEFLVQRRIYA